MMMMMMMMMIANELPNNQVTILELAKPTHIVRRLAQRALKGCHVLLAQRCSMVRGWDLQLILMMHVLAHFHYLRQVQ